MSTKYLGPATFVGRDGSRGFHRNLEYIVEITFTYNMKWEYELSADGRLWCPYASWEAIEKNWKFNGQKRI